MKKSLALLASVIIFKTHGFSQNNSTLRTHEFRGVWIATVANIDYPSRRGMPVDSQKLEFIKIIDFHKANGMNAIVMQVRSSFDAMFPSQYEPWSIFLNGTQGLPPTPYYDPLEFMITECHKRGMEFHAWINPYRAAFKYKENPTSPAHLTNIKPDWFVTYGEHKWANPGVPEVRQHTIRVVRDLIERYDIDGLHMDDYFYPYKVAGLDFPDEKTYREFGNGLSKDDWRRSNCDSIIKNLWDLISSHPHRVKFGISPFGVWRSLKDDPLGSNTTGGGNNYDELYADIRLWLQKGWMDYCVPQLYWELNHPTNRYDVLLDWWNKNTFGRDLYIGHGIYRAGGKGWKDVNEIPQQINLLRQYKTTQGSIYFSSKSFDKNPFGWNDSLRNNYYAAPALTPAMAWIDNAAPQMPTILSQNGSTQISYTGTKPIKGYIIISGESVENAVVKNIIYETKTEINFSNYKAPKVFVASISKNNVLSNWVELK